MVMNSAARSRKLKLLMLTSAVLVSAPLLSGCGTASDATTMGGKAGQAHGNNGKPGSTTTTTPTPTPTPTPTTSITSVTYDTSIGNGVDANGFASLPLNTGASRYYVNSSTGSDSNSCATAKNPATPKATLSSGLSCMVNGNGDQLLVAQGTGGYTFPNYAVVSGFSPQYPTVIQSYDPADPTNEAKLGQATGANRPVVTSSSFHIAGPSINYVAVRGFEFNPGNVADAGVVNTANSTGTSNYLLFENDIFAYTALSFDMMANGTLRAQHIIVRNSSLYGEWSASSHAQGMYAAGVDGLTVEDCVFWHNGWNVNATRGSDPTVGGPTKFNHPIYAQDTTGNTIVRRNVFIDSSTDGSGLKGGATYTQNLSLDNPIGVVFGGGNTYSIDAPNGVNIQASYNAILGGGGINTSPMDWGIETMNGAPGSLVHHNVLAYSSAMAGYGLMADAAPDTTGVALPNYVAFQSNVTYQWSKSGNIQAIHMSSGTASISLIHATYTNNLWDDPSSGTNTNNSGHVFPNAYSEATLLAALGYANRTSFVNDLIRNPEKHVQRQAVLLLLNGYGVDTSAMTW
jgi:hypothetical protein